MAAANDAISVDLQQFAPDTFIATEIASSLKVGVAASWQAEDGGHIVRVGPLWDSILEYERSSKKGGDLRKARRALEEYATQQIDVRVANLREVVEIAQAYANAWLGYMYGTGKGGSLNQQKAFEFYQIAAGVGVGEAQASLGGMYYNGVQDVVPRDRGQAYVWFERASADNASASGSALLDGRLNWLKTKPRIHLHHMPSYQLYAMKQLARILLDDKNSHLLRGVRYLFRAAMGGCDEAQLWLGSYLLVGFREFCDRRKSLFWLQKSGKQGNSSARKILECCVTGHHKVAVDEARRVLKEAGLRTSSREMIEVFACDAVNERFHDSQKFFMERSARTESPSNIPASVYSEFPNSPTCKRYRAADDLVVRANGMCSSKPEDLKKYLELVVDAFLMRRSRPVDELKTETACNVVDSNYPSACEDSLIGRITIRSPGVSPERHLEDTDRVTEAIRIMKLSDVTSKARRLKLARLHCLAGCFQCVSGRYDSALDNFSQSLQLGVDDVPLTLSGQAFCYSEKGQLEQSKDTFLEYLGKAPRCDTTLAKNLYFLAMLSFRQQNWQEMCYYYEQAIEAEMDRLPFLQEVDVQAKRILFGLYLAADTSKMSFCNNCFRIEISNLALRCKSCQEVAVSRRLGGANGLIRIVTVLLNRPGRESHSSRFLLTVAQDGIEEIIEALKSIQRKFSRINNLLQMTAVVSKYNRSISERPAVQFSERPGTAVKRSRSRHVPDIAAEPKARKLDAAAEAHVVGEGAAGTLLAVSLLNPPDSAVKAVLSAGEKLVLKAGLSDDIPTYAERGASGKVAVVIKYETIEERNILFFAPARNQLFTGRVGVLEELWKALHDDLGTASVPGRKAEHTTGKACCNLAALSGLGGTGKTSVAVEYAWLKRDIYSGGCYWLSVDDLEGSIRDLASRVANSDLISSISVKDQLRSVLAHLSALRSLWLLVVDNMDLPELPPLLETILLGPWRQWSDRGSLLVTSRCRPDILTELLYIERKGEVVVLDEFEEAESVEFLQRRTLPVKDEIEFSMKEASVLARKLGHLPLALDQAAAYLLFTRCSLKDYVATYKKQCMKLLKRRRATRPLGDDKSASHRFAVHTTWQMNFDRISSHAEFGRCATTFAQLTAFLAPEKIPFTLLRATDENLFENDSTALRSVVGLLTELSLFREEANKWFALHRLVQEVLQDSFRSQSGKLYDTLLSAISALVSCLQASGNPNLMEHAMSETVGKHEDWGILSSHALVLQEHVFSTVKSVGQEFYHLVGSGLAVLLNNAAIYSSSIGRQPMAKELDYQKLRVLDVMEESLSDDELVRLTSTIIPLPLKVQQNVRRAIGDKTMTGTSHVGGIAWEPKRVFLWNGMIDKFSLDFRKGWMETLRQCSFREARDAVVQMSANLSRLSAISSNETFGKRYVLLSCRARAHLLSGNLNGAVKDAYECIKLGPANCDGYAILAQAFALIECSCVPLARCMAAVAKFLKSGSFAMPWFQKAYPNVECVRVSTQSELQWILSNQRSYRGHTLLLDDFPVPDVMRFQLTEGINFVGLRQFKIRVRYGINFVCGSHCWVNADVIMRNSVVVVAPEVSVSFIHCRVTSTSSCLSAISVDGSVYFDRCQIVDSDAGGLVVVGCRLGMAMVCNCLIKGNKAAGLEARYGGSLAAVGNTVCENDSGFLLGPIPGDCLVQSNYVFMNTLGMEVSHTLSHFVFTMGIELCHTGIPVMDPRFDNKQVTDCLLSMPLQKPSVAGLVIERNEVCDNGTYGVSLLQVTSRLGVVVVRKNLINDNLFWGLNLNSCCDPDPTVAVVVNENVIRRNKCGAMRLMGAGINSHRITDNEVEKNGVAFSDKVLLPSVVEKYKRCNNIRNNSKTLYYPHPQGVWHAECCSSCHSPLGKRKETFPCRRCYASFYCSSSCVRKHSDRHGRLCKFIRSRYSATTAAIAFPKELGASHTFVRTSLNREHKRGPTIAPSPQVGGSRFVVKLQTPEEKDAPTEPIEIYDQSQTVSTWIVNTQLFDLIVNCGVLGEMQGTSKKVFCWAVLEDIDTIRIFFHELAPYTDEW